MTTLQILNCAAGPINVCACVMAGFYGNHGVMVLCGAIAILNYFFHWKPR